MKAGRLLELANYLEDNVDEADFDMLDWGNDCETYGCAMGHARRIPQFELELHHTKTGMPYIFYPGVDELFKEKGHLANRGTLSAALCFDIPIADAVELFSGSRSVMTPDAWRVITPEMQATRIRNYVRANHHCVENYDELRTSYEARRFPRNRPAAEVRPAEVDARGWLDRLRQSARLWYQRVRARLGHRNS